ncbi:MAG: SPW repeat protein [Alphaproteobacteria bacterium]
MADVTFTPPRQWEDWCDWALGIWLVLSPWTLRYWPDAVALKTAVIVGALLILAEVITLSVFRVWEEWIPVALGVFLTASPWLLPIADAGARTNFVVVGLLVAALALYQVRQVGAPAG